MHQVTDTLQSYDDLVQHDFSEKQARALARVTENSMQAVFDRMDKQFTNMKWFIGACFAVASLAVTIVGIIVAAS